MLLRVALMLLALSLVACGEPVSQQPRDGRAGLSLTGTVDGRQVALSDGRPRLVVGNCDPRQGPSRDVCFLSRDIDGTLLVLVLRNPEALRSGTVLPVAPGSCATPAECAEVRDVAVIDVRVGEGPLTRVHEGRLTLELVEPARRYVGTVRLAWPSGRLSGQFDVVPY